MVSRCTGACLGLLAFAVTIIAGLVVHNPPAVTLARAVWALVIFCPLGLVVGACAQGVINEHYRQRRAAEVPSPPEQAEQDETEEIAEVQAEPIEATVAGV